MPTYTSHATNRPCPIFYQVRGEESPNRDSYGEEECGTSYSDRPDVVLIMGFGATHECWGPQLEDGLLTGRHGSSQPKCRVLMIDNRGVGRSGSPELRSEYTTGIMADDVLSLLDHLGWRNIHLVGHSMGSMIAVKIASKAPSRIQSLVLISGSGGGWQAVPKSFIAFWLCLKAVFSSSKEVRAEVDVQLHYNRRMLNSVDDRYGRTRQELLHESYLQGSQGGGTGQPNYGFRGQLHAVWNHSVSEKEAAIIRHAGFAVMVIHGRHDIMASPVNGERLADRLEAPFVMLDGAHMICRERGPEINQLLHIMIFHGRRLKETQHKYLVDDPDDFGQQPPGSGGVGGVTGQPGTSDKGSSATSSPIATEKLPQNTPVTTPTSSGNIRQNTPTSAFIDATGTRKDLA